MPSEETRTRRFETSTGPAQTMGSRAILGIAEGVKLRSPSARGRPRASHADDLAFGRIRRRRSRPRPSGVCVPPMLRVQARSPERSRSQPSVPEWLMAKTRSRSITGRPAISLRRPARQRCRVRDSVSLQDRCAVLNAEREEFARLYGTTTMSPATRRRCASRACRPTLDGAAMIPQLLAVCWRRAR